MRLCSAAMPSENALSVCAVEPSERGSSFGAFTKAAMRCTPSDMSSERQKAAGGNYQDSRLVNDLLLFLGHYEDTIVMKKG